jgi:cystathionine beta-lyase
VKLSTRSLQIGRHSFEYDGMVNLPVHRTSTVLYQTMQAFEDSQAPSNEGLRYGRSGTPTTFALEHAVAMLEGAESAVALPSGLAAVAAALMAELEAGDHLLMADNVFGRTRVLAQTLLRRCGIETTYFDPLDLGRFPELFHPTKRTRAVLIESPGSATFEVTDLPALAALAKARGASVLVDNTWSGSFYHHPLSLGADVSIQAATKYIVGHSDAVVGVASGSAAKCRAIKAVADQLGLTGSPDDCNLALRGLRTLDVRLKRHQENAFAIAHWLAARPEVERVLHPALPSCPGHETWKRDFTGSTGLFSFVLKNATKRRVAAMLDGLEVWRIGGGWGGYESLAMPAYPSKMRSARPWQYPEPCVRLQCGLEDATDLIADLERGLARATL